MPLLSELFLGKNDQNQRMQRSSFSERVEKGELGSAKKNPSTYLLNKSSGENKILDFFPLYKMKARKLKSVSVEAESSDREQGADLSWILKLESSLS